MKLESTLENVSSLKKSLTSVMDEACRYGRPRIQKVCPKTKKAGSSLHSNFFNTIQNNLVDWKSKIQFLNEISEPFEIKIKNIMQGDAIPQLLFQPHFGKSSHRNLDSRINATWNQIEMSKFEPQN